MASVPLIHLVATLFMAGIIVFVQVVHYPLMARVGSAEFMDYERLHTARTGWVVVPPMLLELACASLIFLGPGGRAGSPAAVVGLVLLGVIWTSTALLQAPAHRRLLRGFDPRVHRRLVATNWIRTLAWLARVPVALALL